MEFSEEFSDFLWQWAQELVNPELREIWEGTQHQEFFEVEPQVFVVV